MQNLLRLEELAMFAFSILLFSQTDFQWWWYPALILAPDIGMLGYLAGNRTGAWCYNLLHHKGIALCILAVGWYLNEPWTLLSGIILFGHSSMDRIFGYGLKYNDSFHHTHLGWLNAQGTGNWKSDTPTTD